MLVVVIALGQRGAKRGAVGCRCESVIVWGYVDAPNLHVYDFYEDLLR